MKDNFDVYNWKQGQNSSKENNGEFDLREWNKKRYLGELDIDQYDTLNVNKDDEGSSFNITRGGDDAKMGAELESDANVVGENEFINHPKLALDVLNKNKPKILDIYKKYEGKGQSANREVRQEIQDLLMPDIKNLGIKEEDEEKVFDFAKRGLASLEASMLRKRMGLNEASYMYKGYQDKHFDVCPAAESLRDRLKSGEFGQPDELDLGEWLYQHDVLFGIEKQVIKDKEGEPEDYNEAREAADRIINLSRDLNIPASELKYLKNHLDIIKDMIDYSALTEKDDFAGSDPKAGSTIKGTGFMAPRQKPKVTQRDIDDIEASGNIDIAYNKAMDLLKSMTEREAVKETLRFIKENNPEFTNEEIKKELKEIKELGKQLNEKLCPKGEAYRKRRMAAGEKSSAYLSGRAVKVCKGQMSGKKKKKKK
jgi:hypothetical protein